MAYPYALNTFEESFYLANNPDVVTAIANGDFSSALQHYEMYGENEGRLPNSAFSPQFYFSTYPDVLAAVNAGTIPGALWHFENFGLAEARRPSEQVDFNEVNYLAQNPDVAAAVAAGDFVSGWQHYVMYGQDEGREPGGTTPPPGEIITLTPGVDTVLLDGLQVDTVRGVVDPGTAQQTFTIGDLIDGNGNTQLDLAVANGGNAAFATVKDVASINLLAGTAAAVNFNAVAWSGIGAINLNQGANGLAAQFNNIQAGADLSIAQVSGTLEADQTNGVGIQIWSHQGGSVSYTADLGNVVGTAVTGNDVGATFDAIGNGAAITVGDVTLTGTKADEGQLWVTQTQDKAGDVVVGNVSISGFASIDVGIYNSSHTKDSAAANTTVGDITVATGKSGSISVSVEQTGYNQLGDVSVGNVTMTGGDAADAYFFVENYGYEWAAASNVTVGNTTIGDIAADVGMSGSITVSISASAYASLGSATVGDLTIGSLTASVGQAGDFNFWAGHYATNSGSGDATVGKTTVGDVTLVLATDASGDYTLSATASNSVSGDATVGDVVVGAFDAKLGVNADLTVDYWFEAGVVGAAAVATVGNVTFGNVNFDVNDGASVSYSVSVSSDNGIGNLTFGDLTVAGGVDSDVTYYNYAWAYNTSDIESLTFGNIDVAMKQSGYFYGSISQDATSGRFGDVAIGNVSLAAAKSATAEFYVNIEGETNLGDVTVGDLSLAAQAANAYASFSASFSNDGSGAVGDVTFGNVAMSAAGGQGAESYLEIYVGDAGSAGTLTFGDFDLSVNNKTATALSNWSYVSVSVDNDLGNVVIGNINLSTSTVLAATTDKNFVSASFAAEAQGTLTVGNVSVSGGDGAADNFADLNGWLSLSSSGGKTITIGDVDYSGYGAKATIDVSGYAGAANIAGGAKADTITDNKGTNAITGNGGADVFTFVNDNTGKGLVTMDQILDFSNSGGDKIDLDLLNGVLTVPRYSEVGGLADFGAFNTAANAADKAVFVGEVTGVDGVIAAVDYDENGSVDFMINLVGVDLNGVDVASFV